jgi:two-component system phosphate regulon response regulator OmpR
MGAHTPQILVVDNDPEIRKLLVRYIEGQTFRVLDGTELPGSQLPGSL